MRTPKHHLPIDIEHFDFAQREELHGRKVIFRCGRDFLYYALHYFLPTQFNKDLNPQQIEHKQIFGLRLPTWLIWTGLSFARIPHLLKKYNLLLTINNIRIRYWFQILYPFLLWFRPPPFEDSIALIEKAIDNGDVVGIDLAISWHGLVDHVMFVYGYDNAHLYVFDTQQLSQLEYEKITPSDDMRYIMRLPKSTMKKRWTRFSRVWVIKKET